MGTSTASDAPARRAALAFLLLLLLLSGLCGAACRAPGEGGLARFEYTKPQMGTQFRIVLYAEERAVADGAAEAAFATLGALDRALSDYAEASELSRLSRASQEPLPSPWIPLSADLGAVLLRAREVSVASAGAFDVTCGVASRLWRRAIRAGELPEEAALARARADWRALELSDDGTRARWTRAGLRLDLGGIAKGYALDRMLTTLAEHGAPRALVIGGGDVAAGLPPPGRAAWRIRLAAPTPETVESRGELGAVLLARAAVATSGDLYRGLEEGGRRHSHIVDPRTARALTTRAGASVIARDAKTADALATAATVLGPEGAPALQRAFPGCEFLVLSAAQGGERRFESPGFAAFRAP